MSEPFLGQIIIFAGNFAIRGFANCDGQLLPIQQNSALFSILGTTYGGDGRTNFALPDLRGRFAMHRGQGPGLPNHPLGQKAGIDQMTLTLNQIPAHEHRVQIPCDSLSPNSDDPAGAYPAVSGEDSFSSANNDLMAAFDSGTEGGGQSFSIQNPFVAVTFLIALTGVFPSRN